MPNRKLTRRVLVGVGVMAVLLVCYFFFDRPVARFAERIPAGFNALFHGVSLLAGLPLVVAAGTAMAALFFIRAYGQGRPRQRLVPLIYLPTATFTASLATETLKIVLARYRPGMLIDSGLYGFSFWKAGYWLNSFPSGHATVAFALGGAVGLAFPRWRGPALALAALVALSRVLLNLHYLSDIIAGGLLGIGWALLYRRLFARFNLPVKPEEVTDG